MLVLQRVRQFMRDDRLLSVEVNPVGEIEALRLRVVLAGDLFGQQADDEGTHLEAGRHEAEFDEQRLGGA